MPSFQIFIDSNAFLQMRDLKDLPWADVIAGEQKIDLVVAASVISELDDQKSSSRSRLRNRARAALRLIDKASVDGPVLLRGAPIELRLRLDQPRALDWAAYPSLNPTKPDDRLVAAFLSAEGRKALLTHDRGPAITVRQMGQTAIRPPDDWLLTEEPTEKDQTISELKREVAMLRAQFPAIVLSFDNWDRAVQSIVLRAPILDPLPDALISRLMGKASSLHPMKQFTPYATPIQTLEMVRNSHAEYEGDYRSYRQNLMFFFQGLHQAIEKNARLARIRFKLHNASATTADKLIVTWHPGERSELIVNRGQPSRWQYPIRANIPPLPPDARTPVRSFTEQRTDISAQKPTLFYWHDIPDNRQQQASLICEEFRAQETFSGNADLLFAEDLPYEGEVTFHVSARNSERRLEQRVPLRVTRQRASWGDADVLDKLDSWVADEIRAFESQKIA